MFHIPVFDESQHKVWHAIDTKHAENGVTG